MIWPMPNITSAKSKTEAGLLRARKTVYPHLAGKIAETSDS